MQERTLFMKKQSFLIVFCFFAMWFSACSNVTGSDSSDKITASITGIAEKGPFAKGATITLYELNPKTFAQTGRVFTGTVSGEDGSFSLGKVELGSPYVLVDVTGRYWSELGGNNSEEPISLKAIAHITGDNSLNINIGTHITHKRILSLLESGMAFDKAKEKAESELMETFFKDDSSIDFGNTSVLDNEKLLAISILVLMARTEVDVSETITRLSEGMTSDLLIKLANDAAFRYNDYANVRIQLETRFPNASVGPFEKYICNFWQRLYGLGECSKEKAGTLDTIMADEPVFLICKELSPGSGSFMWNMASDLDISTAYQEPVEDGRLVESKTIPNMSYVYDNGMWRDASPWETMYGKGCLSSMKDSIVAIDGTNYLCQGTMWLSVKISDYKKEKFFNENINYGSVKDERNGQIYRTIEIAGETWMAENLSFKDDLCRTSDCLYTKCENSVGCAYSWSYAMQVSKNDSIVVEKKHQGLCMDGWHVPDTTEWNAVLERFSHEELKTTLGWSAGTNKSGFSIAPTSYSNPLNYAVLNTAYASFVTANFTKRDSDLYYNDGYAVFFDSNSVANTLMTNISSLRCVKD